MVKRAHEFWSQYSQLLIGNWMTYDTPVKEVCDFAERVNAGRDYKGFSGDRKFIRDDQAQKSFSKLRSSIGGVYAWRYNYARTTAEKERMFKEADFAFRQAFAFCPFSPEAVFRYTQLLLSPEVQRFDDALLIAETCLKLDPYNGSVINLVNQLRGWKKDRAAQTPPPNIQQLVKDVESNPANFQLTFNLASAYLQMQQPDRAFQVLDRVVNDPRADASALRGVVEAYARLNRSKLQGLV